MHKGKEGVTEIMAADSHIWTDYKEESTECWCLWASSSFSFIQSGSLGH